jgi:putative restriction endonuclease
MWGLEYALLFGAPENKLELLEGRTPLVWPFPDRETAEAHFALWIETLCRWQGISRRPAVRQTAAKWTAEINGFVLELFPRPIHLEIPFERDAFVEIRDSFWRRDLWPGQPAGRATGWESAVESSDIAHNLWRLFEEISDRYGGMNCGQVAIAMTDRDAIEPDQYYFQASREECMIDDAYFHGPPDILAEMLSPATRWLDRGPRREVFRRAGVRQLWLLEPLLEQVELYELAGRDYRRVATYGVSDTFNVPHFPDVRVNVAELFETQWKRHQRRSGKTGDDEPGEAPEPIPHWLMAPDTRLGLAYLMVLGHPKRRFEIWDNRAPCMLAFGSDEEARTRFQHFLEEACRWEQVPLARPAALEPGMDVAEAGRFRLTRRGHLVHLDVAVDARKYRELLEVGARRESWDWGEE